MLKLAGIKLRNFGILEDFRIGQTTKTESDKAFANANIFIGDNATGKRTLRKAFHCATKMHYGANYVFTHLNEYYTTEKPIEMTFFLSEKNLYAYRVVFGEAKNGAPAFLEESLTNVSENKTLLDFKNDGKSTKSKGFALSKSGKKIEMQVETSGVSGFGSTFEEDISDETRTVKAFFSGTRMLNLSAEKMKMPHTLSTVSYVGTDGSRLEDVLSSALENNEKNTIDIIQSLGEWFNFEDLKIYTKSKYVFFMANNMVEQHISKMSQGFLLLLAYMVTLKGLHLFKENNDNNGTISLLFTNKPETHFSAKNIKKLSHEIWQGLQNNIVGQFFAVTYSPLFLNAFSPSNVWNMERDTNGKITARRVSEYSCVENLYREEIPLGDLWVDDYFKMR